MERAIQAQEIKKGLDALIAKYNALRLGGSKEEYERLAAEEIKKIQKFQVDQTNTTQASF